jgi:NitT/TauT family transport system substrate-binding protein
LNHPGETYLRRRGAADILNSMKIFDQRLRRIAALVTGLLVLIYGISAMGSGEGDNPGEDNLQLSVGLMPAVDGAPVYLAAERGYFADEGLDLEIVLFTSGQDRQSALQTGAVDGAMSDLVALAVNNDAGFDIKAVTLTDGVFPILATPGAADAPMLSLGTMEVSVTNFLVDVWLSERCELEKVWINAIPARLEAVISGQIDAGIFPEPFASAGEARGLERIMFDPPEGITPDVMAFTAAALDEKPEAIRSFLRAYDRAVADLAAEPDLARDVLIRSLPMLDPALRDRILLPEYRVARLPGEAYSRRIIDWTAGVIGRPLNVAPADLVDLRFLPDGAATGDAP